MREWLRNVWVKWKLRQQLKLKRICFHCAIKDGADPTHGYMAKRGYCSACKIDTWVADPDEFYYPQKFWKIPKVVWICFECATQHGGKIPEGHISSWHEGKCDVCCQAAVVTEPRDFKL